MKTLVVDDDYIVRAMLCELLAPYGDCEESPNGLDALKRYKRAYHEGTPYDLIVMDVLMPELSGREVLKKIRNMEYKRGAAMVDEVKVIMISYLGDPEDVVSSFRSGATAYIVKPIDAGVLHMRIKELGLPGGE